MQVIEIHGLIATMLEVFIAYSGLVTIAGGISYTIFGMELRRRDRVGLTIVLGLLFLNQFILILHIHRYNLTQYTDPHAVALWLVTDLLIVLIIGLNKRTYFQAITWISNALIASLIALGMDRALFFGELSFNPSVTVPLYFGSIVFGLISFIYVGISELRLQEMSEPNQNRLLTWITKKANFFLIIYIIIAVNFGISSLILTPQSLTVHIYWGFFKYSRYGFFFVSFYSYWYLHLAKGKLRQNLTKVMKEHPTLYTIAYSIAFDEQDTALPQTMLFVRSELSALNIPEPQLTQMTEKYCEIIRKDLGSATNLEKNSFSWVK